MANIMREEDYDPADFNDTALYDGDVIITLSGFELEEVQKALEYFCANNPINEVQTVGRINKLFRDYIKAQNEEADDE